MFYLCFIEKYDTKVIKVERNTCLSVLLHALPEGKHLRSVTDTFNYKNRLSPGTGGTDAEDLLYKIGMTIIVQIKEINGNATLQKELGKVGSRSIICPLLPRFQIEGRSGKRTGIYNSLRLGIVYQTEQKAFYFLRFVLPTFIFLQLQLLLGLGQLFIFIISRTFVNYMRNQVKGKRRIYTLAATVPETLQPDKRPF